MGGDQNVLDSNIGSNDNAAKLQEEIMKVLVLEKKLDQERDIYHEKTATYKADIQQYSDVQGARNDAEEKRAALNIEREQLQRQRGRFQQAVEGKTRQEQALKSQLQSNTPYMKVSDLEKRYKSLAESNLELSESVEQRKVDATPLRNKVIQLERNHQMWLQEQELLRKEDPLKEQERLGEQIRAGNAATQALERQIDNLDKRIDAASSSHSDLQQQSASLKSGTAAEMKKLLKKQAQLNQMLTEWTQEESQQVEELETTEPQLVNMGEEIRRLKEGIKRLPELGDQNVLDSNIGSNDNAAKLQEEIMKVLVLEKKLDQERDIYHEKTATYKADIQQYSDVQGARNDAEEKRAALNIEREQLQRQRGRFQQAVEGKTRQEQALKSQLQSNTSYMKVSDLEK